MVQQISAAALTSLNVSLTPHIILLDPSYSPEVQAKILPVWRPRSALAAGGSLSPPLSVRARKVPFVWVLHRFHPHDDHRVQVAGRLDLSYVTPLKVGY